MKRAGTKRRDAARPSAPRCAMSPSRRDSPRFKFLFCAEDSSRDRDPWNALVFPVERRRESQQKREASSFPSLIFPIFFSFSPRSCWLLRVPGRRVVSFVCDASRQKAPSSSCEHSLHGPPARVLLSLFPLLLSLSKREKNKTCALPSRSRPSRNRTPASRARRRSLS